MYTVNISELTIEKILERTDELSIFKYYLDDIKVGRTIHSPLRKDNNPSFSVFYSETTKRKFLYKDFATGDTGTCFDLVMNLFGVDLFSSLKVIDRDLNLGISDGKINTSSVIKHDYTKFQRPSTTIIEVTRRNWNNREDKSFWGKYNIKVKTLIKYDVHPIQHIWINGVIVNSHKINNPIYGYRFFKDSKVSWKIYQPYSDRFKWLSNTNKSILQGWEQLPTNGDTLIITKSLKDVMCLYEMGIPAIAPQAESQNLKDTVMGELKDRFKNILVFFDNDFDKTENIGRLQAKKFCEINNLSMIEIDDEYQIKDISDFISTHSINQADELMKFLIQNAITKIYAKKQFKPQ